MNEPQSKPRFKSPSGFSSCSSSKVCAIENSHHANNQPDQSPPPYHPLHQEDNMSDQQHDFELGILLAAPPPPPPPPLSIRYAACQHHERCTARFHLSWSQEGLVVAITLIVGLVGGFYLSSRN